MTLRGDVRLHRGGTNANVKVDRLCAVIESYCRRIDRFAGLPEQLELECPTWQFLTTQVLKRRAGGPFNVNVTLFRHKQRKPPAVVSDRHPMLPAVADVAERKFKVYT